MGTRILTGYLESDKQLKELKNSAAWSFRSIVGGMIRETPNGFYVIGGSANMSMGFVANIAATVTFRQLKPGAYEIQLIINWSWGTFMWVMLVLGPFLVLPLFLMLLYLFFDPGPTYDQALNRFINAERMA